MKTDRIAGPFGRVWSRTARKLGLWVRSPLESLM